ncbi:MAG: DUF2301 domain-containing membrane protein [Elainella sp. Prado103]|nr:DUF2301 domain-containing membrane protein [Elainella sp. Prado103]
MTASTPSPTDIEMTEPIYQGQFGDFTITRSDRREVVIYRAGLLLAALCFGVGVTLGLAQPTDPQVQGLLSFLYTAMTIGLGISLLTIHIYMKLLHRVLQAFWLVGSIAAVGVAHADPERFVVTVYQHPVTLWGVGFTFAALTGIFFKEAFCFNRLETKLLTLIVPTLLLGHLTGILSIGWEKGLLAAWAVLFVVFALRKAFQAIPPDIGDKSVFEYLKRTP